MKNFVLLLVFFAGTWYQGTAQVNTPAPSPFCKFEQKVGLTDVTLEFSRPSVKGRELFVDVEKFGQMWRTGANQSTKVSFSTDVKVQGMDVPKGTYALYSIPGKDEFTVMLYKDLKLGGQVSKYDEAQELIRFTAKTARGGDFHESFFIMIDQIKSDGAVISILWGDYKVPFSLEVDTEKAVMASIEKTFAGGSSRDYYLAASYYHSTGKDMNQALKWIQKANEMDARYWQVRKEAQILKELGKMKEAKNALVRSSELAVKAENPAYAEGNKDLMKKWGL